MTQLRKQIDGTLHDSNTVEREIRQTTSAPAVLDFTQFGYDVVFPGATPTYDPITQTVRQGDVVLTNKGTYEQTWEIVDLSPEQIEANQEAALLVKRSVMNVSPWQMRKALSALGLREAVETAIASATLVEQDAWQYALEVKRLDPLVVLFGQLLNKTDIEMDDLFTLASTL